jgi:cyclase
MRIIPCLQLMDEGLVKTTKFSHPKYIGDPLNTVRIFNELEVDELCFLDIRATLNESEPPYNLLEQIAAECFMPLSYGGGIRSFEQAQKIFRCGIEKIILNSANYYNKDLIRKLSEYYGSQAIIAAIDVKKNFWGHDMVTSHSGTKKQSSDPVQWALAVQQMGAGEILLTAIDREGTWSGFHIELIRKVSTAVSIPVIAHGGAGAEEHIRQVAISTAAGAVAVGSFFLYQKKDKGVLVNFPRQKLEAALASISL